VGCYLFGCDFGKRLSETAPPFLRKIGTFPHWAQGTVDSGDGSPAFLRHMEVFRGTSTGVEIQQAQASLPVHPTQIYESLVGLGLLLLLLFARRKQLFRGQQFYLFTFSYGFCRFLLEIIRDDTERGEYGPSLPEHLFLSGALLLFAAAFAYGPSLGLPRGVARTVARAVAFVPAPIAFVSLAPPSFGQHVEIQLSTSQWIAITSALVVAFFYARDFQEARKNPRNALGIWVGGQPPEGTATTKAEAESAAPDEGVAASDSAATGSADRAESDESPAEGIEAAGGAKAT
jgi:phosphatidylglycerol:prolipoprotein diacylglycerol transferase